MKETLQHDFLIPESQSFFVPRYDQLWLGMLNSYYDLKLGT